MCIYLSFKTRKQTAKKDIVCYKDSNEKRMKTRFLSWWLQFKYILGKKYEQKIEIKRLTELLFGFKGFHSYVNKYSCHKSLQVRCVIPKGAKYYLSQDKSERISNQIIIKEYIN